jgi:glucose/arabinose dehydrogenase
MRVPVLFTAIAFLLNICSAALMAQPSRLIADRLAYIDNAIQVLSFSNDPDEERLFFMAHTGKIYVFENGDVREQLFFNIGEGGLDIVDFGIGSEEGLNGMALDPNYAENGYFYLMYNGWLPDGSGTTLYDEHVVRFRRSFDDPYTADPTFWEEIITFEMPRRGHNGGNIHFGTDGYLYLSVGDGGSTGSGASGGGSGGDADNNGQRLDVTLGKILRLDVSGPAPYTIPADNPFVQQFGARGEIWAYGLRNPWRWSFDRLTGDMYVGDVGEVDWEEINYTPAGVAGANYGWRLLEGPDCYEPIVDCDPEDLTDRPIFAYRHDQNLCSVIGGFVYRGTQIPSLNGYYMYSDACGFGEEKFWTLTETNTGWVSKPVEMIVEGGFVPWQEVRYGFGEDNQGELYICTRLAVYKITNDPDDIGNNNIDAAQLQIRPNPAVDQVTLDLGGNFTLESLEFFDLNGRMADISYPIGGAYRTVTLDIGNLAAGVYIVRARYLGFDQVKTGKLLINRAEP